MTNAAAQYALAQVGKPYQWGATGPVAFDCSGLVLKSYSKLGIFLPHNAGLQAEWFKNRQRLFPNTRYYRQRVLPGDVVFYYGSLADPGSITHCAVYVRRPVLDYRHLVVAAVDEQYGVMEHRMYWALAPIGFGFNH